MSRLEPYKLAVKTIVKSKAKLFKFIPLKSVVAGEIFDISFQFQNIGDDDFPGASFKCRIDWPSEQFDTIDLTIPNLRKNEVYKSDPTENEALCDGYGLIFTNEKRPLFVKDKQNIERVVKFYIEGKKTPVPPEYSISGVKAKRSEEIYEFWAMIISAVSLFIIALEKVISFLI